MRCCVQPRALATTRCAQVQARASDMRVALVTGGNKGIGKEIARKLASNGVRTIIGSRDAKRGEVAASELRSSTSGDVLSVPLDLTKPATLAAAAAFVAEAGGGSLDILVNNAAICFNDPSLYGALPHPYSFAEQAPLTLETNFFGTLALTDEMLPLLHNADSPRVVNVVSYAGRLAILKSRTLNAAFTAEGVTRADLDALMREFLGAVEDGTHAQAGWPGTCYGLSKLGLIAWTRAMARDEAGVTWSAVDPGYCATDQNMNRGTDSAAMGAATPAWLALMDAAEAQRGSGALFRGKRVVEW